jgi:hypothetical protein
MRKFGLIAGVLLLLAFVISCESPSSQVLQQKNQATGNGGLIRDIKVVDAITGTVLYEHAGKVYIADASSSSDATLLWTEEKGSDGKIGRKTDIIGSHFVIIADEQQPK